MIGVIDYGLGNVQAFLNIFSKYSIPCIRVQSKGDLALATRLILPGVGSFDEAMAMLDDSGLRQALDYAVLQKKIPVLGICVGMQMMAASSEEGRATGLSWFDACVKKISTPCRNSYPLPHMGWNQLTLAKKHPLFDGLSTTPRFYFLHSYYCHTPNQSQVLAHTDYANSFPAVLVKDHIVGIQCHPEKSHQDGERLLLNFANY